MGGFGRTRRQKLILAMAAGAALLCAPLVIAWSGVYSVAASEGHLAIVDWFLHFGMRNSVKNHAWRVEVPPTFEDMDRVMIGASHFHNGCMPCHGAPGHPPDLVGQQMLPPPPDLSTRVAEWKDRELFWITRHGIKYTGMPGWAAEGRDDEVWALVAFLRKLPGMDAAQYRELALGTPALAATSAQELTAGTPASSASAPCERCHGAQGRLPRSTLVPVLYGQTPTFLVEALNAYADGTRASGIMEPIAAELEADERQRVAAYYAGQALTSGVRTPATLVGESLAVKGRPGDGIPGCVACHGPEALPGYPRLAGQNAKYLAGQLQLWKRGGRSEGPLADIMGPIARLLTAPEIDEVSAYFASLPVGSPR